MADRKVHILGSVWSIKEQSISENNLLENCDGYCDWTVREIVVEREQNGTLGDMETYIRKVIRHEIVHAFLFESGLYESSAPTEQEWISVKDRMPEDDSDVLAYLRTGEESRIYPANYAKGMWFDCLFNTPATESTTHWMPLPQPPKGE